jgi:RNA-directed DNA polymerase
MPMTSSSSAQQSAAEALAWTHAVMTKLGLTLNGAKTSVKDAQL